MVNIIGRSDFGSRCEPPVLPAAAGGSGRSQLRRDQPRQACRADRAAVIPVQVLGELFNVLVRKAGKSRDETREALLGWRDAFPVIETSPEIMLSAGRSGNRSPIRNLGRRHPVGSVASELPFAAVRSPARGLHMGRRDRRQSVRLSTARPAEWCRPSSGRALRMAGESIGTSLPNPKGHPSYLTQLRITGTHGDARGHTSQTGPWQLI